MNVFHFLKSLHSRQTLTLRARFLQSSSTSFPLTSLQCGKLLQSFTNSRALRRSRELHAHVLSSGVLLDNTYLLTKLAAMYAICGRMLESQSIFDIIILKSSFLWNIMIRGYACNRMGSNALVLYREMLALGKLPDNYTYPFVLMACGDLSLFDVGKRFHCEVIIRGYDSDIYIGNSLLAMYFNLGKTGFARNLFDKLPERDLTSWNTMLVGYTKNGDPNMAILLFSEMIKIGVKFDHATLLGVLPACADLMAIKPGKEIHAYVLRNCMEFDAFLTNAFLNVYLKSGFTESARQLFERMNERDIVTWNTMISGYASHGDALESLRLFCLMNSEGLVPDAVTLIAALGACDKISALQFGRSLHGHVAKKGLDAEIFVGTALLDMYAKCGNLSCSVKVFDLMPKKNLISWSAMISVYGLHGRGKEAITCFNEMKEREFKPDEITFTSVLSACSHSGLINEGKEIFYQMSSEYSMTPCLAHYSCMVDLLGRAGKLHEAYELIKNMEIEPNVDVWAAFLSACRVHHNVELAEIAAQNAFCLNPQGVGLYVSLSNIYAVERRWADVERVRAIVRQNRLKKQPGCSFVELNMSIYRFIVGDKSHPQYKSIYAKLNEIREQLKKDGHIADTTSVLYDVEDHVKERMLWDHSERLAIAFALLNTSPGTTIRITKNLRVCGDCHTTTKLISKLVARQIVVRDAHRFHHFQNGYCSCGDYW